MSGIVGIAHLDGGPIDDDLLQGMTDSLTFRGPEGRQVWSRKGVGFGHTWLRTSMAEPPPIQPLAVGDSAWLLADVRLDARPELIQRLEAGEGRRLPEPASDVELLGRAYRAWGERCVDHLLGDFAFAVWEERSRRLFVARDQLGVKPIYYAHLGSKLVFSNTMACVRRYSGVSGRLNDLAIADFLLFGGNRDSTTTSFADVRRLPPGHRATFTAEGARVERYWHPPVDEPIRYRHARDYEEQFRGLIDTAVRDRLPDGPVGIFLSGGLDSGTLAAAACGVRRRAGASADVRAFTTVWDGFDQHEAEHAGLTASFLGIPIEYRHVSPELEPADSLWDRDTPEPLGDSSTKQSQYHRWLSEQARVFFFGEGPDNLLTFEWRAYLRYMWRRRQFGSLARDVAAQTIRDGGRGWIGPLRRVLRQSAASGENTASPYPAWLNPSFEARHHLRDRWCDYNTSRDRLDVMRPQAQATLDDAIWDLFFQAWDCEATTAPLEVRHPYLDLRVLRYLLRVPTVPWCRSKRLLRRAMRGRLPDAVLHRRKSPLPSDPIWEAARRGRIGPIEPAPGLEVYVDARSVPVLSDNGRRFHLNLRPYKLSYWLRRKDDTHEGHA